MLTFPAVPLFCPSKLDTGIHSSFNVSEHISKIIYNVCVITISQEILCSKLEFHAYHRLIDSNLHDSTKDTITLVCQLMQSYFKDFSFLMTQFFQAITQSYC